MLQRMLIVTLALLLAGCATTEAERKQRRSDLARAEGNRDRQREACEASRTGAWVCTTSVLRSTRASPLHQCVCADNRFLLDGR